MPKLEIELTDEVIANIAKNNSLYGANEELVAAAKAAVNAKLKGSVIADLADELRGFQADSKAEAIEAVVVLKEAHSIIEDLLVKLGLEYEIHIMLVDGRYLDLCDHSYGGKGSWMTSSDNC